MVLPHHGFPRDHALISGVCGGFCVQAEITGYFQDEHQAIVGAKDLGLFYARRTKGLQDVGPDLVGLVPALVLGNQLRALVEVDGKTEACHDQTLTAATMPADPGRSANVRTIAKQKSGAAMAQ